MEIILFFYHSCFIYLPLAFGLQDEPAIAILSTYVMTDIFAPANFRHTISSSLKPSQLAHVSELLQYTVAYMRVSHCGKSWQAMEFLRNTNSSEVPNPDAWVEARKIIYICTLCLEREGQTALTCLLVSNLVFDDSLVSCFCCMSRMCAPSIFRDYATFPASRYSNSGLSISSLQGLEASMEVR